MKHIIYSFLFLFSGILFAQTGLNWSDPVSVANVNYGFYRPRIALSANQQPVVMWGKGGAATIYASALQPEGFSPPVKVNPDGVDAFVSDWAGPDMATHDSLVYIVYKQQPEETGNLWLAISTNNGLSFGQQADVDDAGFVSRFPAVTVNELGNPLVAFMKFDSGWNNPHWVATYSENGGTTFMPDTPAGGYSGGEACDCCPGNITANGNKVAVQYRDNLDNLREIWAGFSTDGGETYPQGFRVDDTNWHINQCPSSGPDGFIDNDTLYSVFMSKASGKNLVYFSAVSLNTQTLAYTIPFTAAPTNLQSQNFPRTDHRGLVTATVWEQRLTNGKQILLAINMGSNYPMNYRLDTLAFSTNTSAFENPDLVIADNKIYVVWQDNLSQTIQYATADYQPPVISGIEGLTPATHNFTLGQSFDGNNLFFKMPDAELLPDAHIAIYTLTGQPVYMQALAAETCSVNIAKFAPGIYFFVLYKNNRSVETKRFIKR